MEKFRVNWKKRYMDFGMPSPHVHNICELYYLVSGQCKMFVGHQLYYVEAGDMLLLVPGMLHRATYPDGGMAERVTISFSLKELEPLEKVCGEDYLGRLLKAEKISVPLPLRSGLESILQKMEEEVRSGDPLSLFLAKNRLYEVFGILGKCQTDGTKNLMGETEKLIQQASRYIYQNFEKVLVLPEVAEMVHMTPTYFSRKFKEVTGLGFKEYLIYVRIGQAEKLLVQTSLPITEIAIACGFGDGNYFGDSFKKIKGISPRLYRKKSGR